MDAVEPWIPWILVALLLFLFLRTAKINANLRARADILRDHVYKQNDKMQNLHDQVSTWEDRYHWAQRQLDALNEEDLEEGEDYVRRSLGLPTEGE